MTALTWFRAGAWCWIATGTGHLLGDIAMRTTTSDSEAIDALMRAHTLELFGVHRSYYQLMMSFSLAMGLALVFVGILLLYLARTVDDIRPVAALALAMSVVSLAMSVWLDPPPPIVLFGVACTAFVVSLRTGRLAPVATS
ncbi:LIC_13387 family protein [Mycobacterium sp. NPDC003323]